MTIEAPSEKVERIRKIFRKLLNAVNIFVRKLIRAFIITFRNIPRLGTHARIYLRTKNTRIKRKQQKLMFMYWWG